MMRMILNQKTFPRKCVCVEPAPRWSKGQGSHDGKFAGGVPLGCEYRNLFLREPKVERVPPALWRGKESGYRATGEAQADPDPR